MGAALLLACNSMPVASQDTGVEVAKWRVEKYPVLISNHWSRMPAMPLDTRDILEMWPTSTPISLADAKRVERLAATLEVIERNDDAPVSGVIAFSESYALGLTRRCRVVSWVRGKESIYMRADCRIVAEVRRLAAQRDRDWIDALCGCQAE